MHYYILRTAIKLQLQLQALIICIESYKQIVINFTFGFFQKKPSNGSGYQFTTRGCCVNGLKYFDKNLCKKFDYLKKT